LSVTFEVFPQVAEPELLPQTACQTNPHPKAALLLSLRLPQVTDSATQQNHKKIGKVNGTKGLPVQWIPESPESSPQPTPPSEATS
jgi:hypothetical protein